MTRLWHWWRARPLLIHLLGVGLLVQGVALGIVYVGQERLINTSVADLARAHAAQTTPLLASALSSAIAQRDYATLQSIVDESLSPNGISRIVVFDALGRKITRDASATGLGETLVEVTVPLALGGQKLGRAELGFSRKPLEAIEERLYWWRLSMTLLSLAVVVVGFGTLAYFLIRPLKRLTEESKAIASGAPMTDTGMAIGAEINTLQQTFASMSESIRSQVTGLEATRNAAETASRAKSEFLSKVSHEIRTPLNGVMGMLELLKQSGLNDEQAEYAEISYRSGESLLVIINDILDVSRMEAGELQLVRQPFALKELITHTAQLFAGRAAEKGLALKVEVDLDLPEYVLGDASRVRQILSNLISNAIKFSEKGTVGVAARSEDLGRHMVLRVVDNGVGMDADELALIFQPFVQADNSNTRRFGGMGLGLSIARSLAEAMGGSIAVSSLPSVGTSFVLHLPLTPVASPAVVATSAPTAPHLLKGLRVLLVEDNDINLQVARGMMAHFGCQSATAVNGKEALARMEHATFDLILMDCQMPVMDGFAATVAIRERELRDGMRHIPIIAVTANAADSDRQKCLAHGMDDFLAKPYTEEALRRVMAKYAQGKH